MSPRTPKRRSSAPGALRALVCVSALAACESPRGNATISAPAASEPSPNASILPAPLAGARASGAKRSATQIANLPPRAFPHDRELASEPNPDPDVGGLELRAEFAWPEVEQRELPLDRPARGASDGARSSTGSDGERGATGRVEGAARGDGKGEAKSLSTLPSLRIRIMTNGRMFAELVSPTFTLPTHTRIEARVDRYGHVVVWPDGRSYRVAPRGSLRALFEERRVDVAPLLDGDVTPDGGGQRFELPSVRRKIRGPLGEVLVESVIDASLGTSGTLLCRFLLELSRLDPASDLCPEGELPVEAIYAWASQGELRFRVTAVKRIQSFAAAAPGDDFSIPPAMPIFKPGELPPEQTSLLWTEAQSRKLFGAPEGAELALNNPSDLPLFVIVDRLPLARVDAGSFATFVTAPRSRSVAFRDFLGERVEAPRTVNVPGRLSLGREPEPAASEGGGAAEVPGGKPPEPAPSAKPR